MEHIQTCLLYKKTKQLKVFRVFLQGAVQEISSIYQFLNNAKHQFDSCLNHLTKPDIVLENMNQ